MSSDGSGFMASSNCTPDKISGSVEKSYRSFHVETSWLTGVDLPLDSADGAWTVGGVNCSFTEKVFGWDLGSESTCCDCGDDTLLVDDLGLFSVTIADCLSLRDNVIKSLWDFGLSRWVMEMLFPLDEAISCFSNFDVSFIRGT